MMQQPTREYVPITETKATSLAEFLTSGEWRFHSHFALIGRVERDDLTGQWRPVNNSDEMGEVYGNPVGELFSCFKCGSHIQYHFAIQDRKTGRIVNLGMECINHIDGDKAISKAVAIVKGLQSLKRKIQVEYKKSIHHKQMVEFLKENLETLATPRRLSVAEKLEKNPEHFWKSASYIVETKTKRIEMTRTKWERTESAEKDMNQELLYWENFVAEYERMYWNPKTMQPILQTKLNNQGFSNITVPQLRKLTVDEKKAMKKQMFIEVQEYEKRVNT
jgi:hypothetical protein